jgi:hypothetical protein
MSENRPSQRPLLGQKEARSNRSSLFLGASAVALVVVAGLVTRMAIANSELAAAERRAVEAYAERWTGLAEHYAAREANRQQAASADAARWTALAQHYAEAQASRERSWAAYAARYNGLAAAYGHPAEAQPTRERAWDAIAAAYAGRAIRLAAESGSSATLPNCLAPSTRALLEGIIDQAHLAGIPSCP